MVELYDGLIVDVYYYFWDLQVNYYFWFVEDVKILFCYGDYSVIKCCYLLVDYFGDVGVYWVVEMVYVEIEWDLCDLFGEICFVYYFVECYGVFYVVVVQVWLDVLDVVEVLVVQVGFVWVCSVCYKFGGL